MNNFQTDLFDPYGQNGPKSNSNEQMLPTQNFKTGASTPDTVLCHTQDNSFLGEGVTPLFAEDTVHIFQAQPTGW